MCAATSARDSDARAGSDGATRKGTIAVQLGVLVEFGLFAIAIIVCGAALTWFADGIARRTGFGRLWVGSVFLAGATSLPELSVDIAAARQGFIDVAVGGLVGSNLFNLLILGVLDLTHHSRGRLLSRISAAHALSGVVSIALMSIAAGAIAIGLRGYIGPIGAGSVGILAAYAFGVRMVYCDQQGTDASRTEPDPSAPPPRLTLAQAVAGYIATAGVILVAGPFLASSAGELAETSGLGETFVGSTFVAAATSLPELVTTITAVRLGAFDLALGNIFGSNSFNIVLLAVVELSSGAPLLGAASPVQIVTCLAAILITAVAVLGQLYHIEARKRFVEPDALLVIGLVVAALVVLYWLGEGPR